MTNYATLLLVNFNVRSSLLPVLAGRAARLARTSLAVSLDSRGTLAVRGNLTSLLSSDDKVAD